MASAARLAAPLLLLALALQGILGASALDAAFDETTHLPSGVTYWTTGRIELNQQHPPLVKLLAALPVVAAGARSVFDPARAAEPGYEWRHGAAFLAANGRARVLLLGRLPMIALSLLLAWWVFRWARDLFGPAAGLAALTLCCFSPTVVAHGRLVTMDVPLAAFATQTAYLLWRYGRTPSRRLLVGAGLSLGLALATKFSALLLLPAAAAVLAVARLRPVAGRRPRGRPAWGGPRGTGRRCWRWLRRSCGPPTCSGTRPPTCAAPCTSARTTRPATPTTSWASSGPAGGGWRSRSRSWSRPRRSPWGCSG